MMRSGCYWLGLIAGLLLSANVTAQGISGILPIVTKSGANNLFGPDNSTLALIDLDNLKSKTVFVNCNISPATKRGLSSSKNRLTYFSDIQGKKVVCVNIENGAATLILPPVDGYLVWPSQTDPPCFLFQGARVVQRTAPIQMALWIFRPGKNDFQPLPLVEGRLKSGSVVLDEEHVAVATESDGRSTLWYLGTNGEKKVLFTEKTKGRNFTILGEVGRKIVLGSYTVTNQGKAKDPRLSVVDLEGKVTESTQDMKGVFRLSRLVKADERLFLIASDSLSDTGGMRNQLLKFNMTGLEISQILTFDYWYSENIYTRNDKIYLFSSFSNEPTSGYLIDLATRSGKLVHF